MTSTLEIMSVAARRRENTRERVKAAKVGPELFGSSSGGGMASKPSGSASDYRDYTNWVYAAIRITATKIAQQAIVGGHIEGATPNPERSISGTKRVSSLELPMSFRKNASLNVEVLDTHPAVDGLWSPNETQGKNEFIFMSVANIMLTGFSYWIGGVDKSNDDNFFGYAVPSSWIIPNHEKGPFSAYGLKTPKMAVPEPLPPGSVGMTYIPDPSNPLAAFSPSKAVPEAIGIDKHILKGQAQMMERGIIPKLAVTVAEDIGPDGKKLGRPVVDGPMRRSLNRAVREIMGNTINYGDVAVLDGFIEKIHKLQSTPEELDWLNSSNSVKERILQVFGTNPIVLGQILGSNRAQSAEADKLFCNMTVNPLIDAFSCTMTDWIGPMYDDNDRLVIYIEPCKPLDEDLQLKKWTVARKNEDASADEFRATVLGLGPQERKARNPLMRLVGGVSAAKDVLIAVGQGLIAHEAAIQMMVTFFEMDEEEAKAMVEPIQVVAADPDSTSPPKPSSQPVVAPDNDSGSSEPAGEVNDEAPEADSGKAYATLEAFTDAIVSNMAVEA